jgi:SEC-C motif
MTDHSGMLDRYRRMREVRFRLNNLLVKMIPKKDLEACGRILGFSRKGVLFFETEDETSLLMDYCIFYPGPDGRNLVAKYLEKSTPSADSDEMAALQSMTHAYYSLFQVVDVKRGTGVAVRDLLRGETGFIVDLGFGSTAQRHMIVATRIIPEEGFLMTGGAGLPVDASTAERISKELKRAGYNPETFDYKRITPRQEAEVAAIVIRECRSTGMTSRIAYAEPGSHARPTPGRSELRRIGRNDPCPCGSGKKFKTCCGRSTA